MPKRGRSFSMGQATLSGPVAVDEGEIRGSRKKFSGRKGRAERRVRLLRARGSVELGKVTSGSVTQSLWLGYRIVGFKLIGKDQSRLSGIGQLGKLGKEEEKLAIE